jgi:hypothetical protein
LWLQQQMSEWRSDSVSPATAENGQAASAAVDPDDIHRQVERIIHSGYFRDSLRLTSFLNFVVKTTLAGKSASIKAYTVAVEALGRGSNFDPQRDPIVRVEAGRLRQALARYYATAGREDSVMIDLPRGTYVPQFHWFRTARHGLTDNGLTDNAAGDDGPRADPATARPIFAERCREYEILQRRLRQRFNALAAEIRSTRWFVEQSRALLTERDRPSALPSDTASDAKGDIRQRSNGKTRLTA